MDEKCAKLITLYKRFLKEHGIVMNIKLFKKTVDYMFEVDDEEGHFLIPFDGFMWDDTSEGGLYWFGMCLKWSNTLIDELMKDDGLFDILYKKEYDELIGEIDVLLHEYYCDFDIHDEYIKDYRDLEKRREDIKWKDATYDRKRKESLRKTVQKVLQG